MKKVLAAVAALTLAAPAQALTWRSSGNRSMMIITIIMYTTVDIAMVIDLSVAGGTGLSTMNPITITLGITKKNW